MKSNSARELDSNEYYAIGIGLRRGSYTTSVIFELTEPIRRDLILLCQRFNVRRLKLFGSALTESFDLIESDLDVLVEFDAPPPQYRLAQQFFLFHEELESLFGRKLDLLEERAIENSAFRDSAQSTAVTLYAA